VIRVTLDRMLARVMDSNESDVAEANAHILTFDIPDDVLERAAGAAPLMTLAPCTLHWYDCTWPQ
jgi:hypothetical protein